jgi:2-methylcitrate dehydratase PrpD
MIMKNTYKPFACGIVAHPAIDGAIRIRRQGIDPEHIEKVFIGVHPLALELTGRPSPRDQLEAIFSVYHGVAVGLLEGKGGQWQFSDKKVRDEKVTALRQKVEAAVDDALGVDQARGRVVMDDGSSADVFVEETLGSLKSLCPIRISRRNSAISSPPTSRPEPGENHFRRLGPRAAGRYPRHRSLCRSGG